MTMTMPMIITKNLKKSKVQIKNSKLRKQHLKPIKVILNCSNNLGSNYDNIGHEVKKFNPQDPSKLAHTQKTKPN
jgi:hypothetical protein